MVIAILIITTFFIVVGLIIVAILKRRSSRKNHKRDLRIAITALVITYLFMGYSIYTNSKPNELIIASDYIEFTESHGIKIKLKDIQNIQQTTLLPDIKSRINGFSLMNIRKGTFETKSGEIIHLLINGSNKPVLKITKTNQEKIYFNSPKENSIEDYKKLQNIFSYQK